MVVGDFDGDHNADVAFTTTACFRGGCNPSNLYVLYGSGTGKFTAKSFANSGELRISSVDINQDGRSDLAISKYCTDGTCTGIGAILGNGDRTFTEAVSPANSADANVLGVADLNGDLKNDLVDSYGIEFTMGAYLGLATSASTWNKQIEVPLSNVGAVSEMPITGDFNGDRKPDVAIYQAQQGVVQLLLDSLGTETAPRQ